MKREPVERNESRRFFNRIKFREEDNKSVNVAKLKWVEKKQDNGGVCSGV